MRAWRSRSACAWRDMASSRPCGNFHVADFDRLHGDAPRVRLFVEDALQFAAHGFAFGDHLGEFVAADGFAQGGLRAHGDGLDEVLDFEDGFLGVPDHPEDDGVDVDGDRVAGQRRFGGDAGDADTLVDVGAERFDDRNDVAHAGSAQADVAAEAQHGDLFPLADDFDREEKVEADQGSDDGGRRVVHGVR